MSDGWPAAPPMVVAREDLPPQPPRQRVKVLHVITRLAGGSGGNTLASAAGMDEDAYELWLAGGTGGLLWAEAERAGIHAVQLARMRENISPVDDVLTCLHLLRLMRRERFDVVHTHCAKAGLVGRLAARLAGVPVVVHTFHALAVHDRMPRARRRAYLTLERLARSFAHHYLAVAPQLAREAVALRLARAGTMTVVPSGVDLSVVMAATPGALRRELELSSQTRVVGTVGRIVAQKAPLDFVRMAAAVRESCPDTVFVMVGDTALESRPLEAETRAEAARLGVPVVFTGYREDAAVVAADFDVYVVPSHYEGLGRALTEAMASGRPVVATAVNGVPDLVEPGATGLLAPPEDPKALAAAVVWMLEHPDAARRMGQQGRARVGAAFDVPRMCRDLDGVYRRLLGMPETAAPAATRDDEVSAALHDAGDDVAESVVRMVRPRLRTST